MEKMTLKKLIPLKRKRITSQLEYKIVLKNCEE